MDLAASQAICIYERASGPLFGVRKVFAVGVIDICNGLARRTFLHPFSLPLPTLKRLTCISRLMVALPSKSTRYSLAPSSVVYHKLSVGARTSKASSQNPHVKHSVNRTYALACGVDRPPHDQPPIPPTER